VSIKPASFSDSTGHGVDHQHAPEHHQWNAERIILAGVLEHQDAIT
jgi:hypothetical protein